MNTVRQAALERQLSVSEAALIERLLEILPRVVESGENIFLGGRFLPAHYHERWVSSLGTELLEIADDCIAQRNALAAPSETSVGALYLSVCTESADMRNGNRRGPRRLAAFLLSQLTSNGAQPNNSLERTRER